MLDITHGTLIAYRPRQKFGRPSIRYVIAGLWRLVARWADRAHQRRILAAMDDRLLSDIGVTRLDAEFEAKKPFWR